MRLALALFQFVPSIATTRDDQVITGNAGFQHTHTQHIQFGYPALKVLLRTWESEGFIKSWSSIYLCPLANHPTSLTTPFQSVKRINPATSQAYEDKSQQNIKVLFANARQQCWLNPHLRPRASLESFISRCKFPGKPGKQMWSFCSSWASPVYSCQITSRKLWE